jgi:hypothetical protein
VEKASYIAKHAVEDCGNKGETLEQFYEMTKLDKMVKETIGSKITEKDKEVYEKARNVADTQAKIYNILANDLSTFLQLVKHSDIQNYGEEKLGRVKDVAGRISENMKQTEEYKKNALTFKYVMNIAKFLRGELKMQKEHVSEPAHKAKAKA